MTDPTLLRALAGVVGQAHVLTGDAAAGYGVDWTGRFGGQPAAVVRPRDTAEVAAVLALCTEAGVPVVPQGGNTGLVGGGVPVHGEVVLSLARLDRLGPADLDAAQVTAGAGVTLELVAGAAPGLDLGVLIASRASATVGGAIATNAGGLRVLRYGPMRAQLRGIEAVLADGTVLSHLAGLVKDNTGYDYPALLAGSEGTLAVITRARLRLVRRPDGLVTVLAGLADPAEAHRLARRAVTEVPGLLSAEFFTAAGLDVLASRAGLPAPLARPAPCYLLLEAAGPGALDDLAGLAGDRDAAVAESAADRARLWAYRERHPEAAGFLGHPGQAGRGRARRALGPAGHRGGGGGGGGRPGRPGDHLRPRRRRQPARQHRPGRPGGRPSRGRGVLLRRLAGRLDLGRARHRRAQGPLAAAGPVGRRAGPVRPDPRGVRPGRHAEPARAAALSYRRRASSSRPAK